MDFVIKFLDQEVFIGKILDWLQLEVVDFYIMQIVYMLCIYCLNLKKNSYQSYNLYLSINYD